MSTSRQKPLSLRLRLVILAILLLTISLGLVGFGLDSAFHKSSEASLQTRMESLVYLVLAATDITDDGTLMVEDDIGDPRLRQPGSGLFARVHSDLNDWSSPSSVSRALPDLLQIPVGQSLFSAPLDGGDFYSLLYAVSFELSDARLVPVTVSIFVDRQELQSEQQSFRTGLWRSLGITGVILVLAHLLLLSLGLRP